MALIPRIVMAAGFAALAQAAGTMPASQQNALVQKYCAVCHTDAARNGGLSLQHFDAATASPSLTAILLSKISGGVILKTIGEPGAALLLHDGVAGGAINAAGVPTPDQPALDAFVSSLAAESRGAMEWSGDTSDTTDGFTASILREVPSKKNLGKAESYRVTASCNAATKEGSLQLTWSPVPQSGSVLVAVDGKPEVAYRIEGGEHMGNGTSLVVKGRAAVLLAEVKGGKYTGAIPFPSQSLTVKNLFPDETVQFPFASLPPDMRRALAACFAATPTR